jgi:hypothetical protein
VLFEMLAGRHPFAGARTEAAWIDAHLAREAPRLREFVDVPKRVDDVVDAALSKEPARRPRDARAFMVALQELKSRPSVGVLANTTVEDLHTAIEKQTETGYEAYATAENTLEGFTAPAVLGNGTLEDAFPSFAVGVTVTAPGQRASAPPPAALIAQVATAGDARRGIDRKAETRSSRLPERREPRERDHETEELLAGLIHPASARRASPSRGAEPTWEPAPHAPRAVEARTPSAPVATPLPAAQIARVSETASLASPRHDDGKARGGDAWVLVTALVVGALVAGGATLGLTRRAAPSPVKASTPAEAAVAVSAAAKGPSLEGAASAAAAPASAAPPPGSTPSASASHAGSASSVVSVSAAAAAPAPERPSGPPARTLPAAASAAAPRTSKPSGTPTPHPPPADTFAPPERDISF